LGLFTAIQRLKAVHARSRTGWRAADCRCSPSMSIPSIRERWWTSFGTPARLATRHGCAARRGGCARHSLRAGGMEACRGRDPTVLHAARRLANGGSAYDDARCARAAQAFGRLIRRATTAACFVDCPRNAVAVADHLPPVVEVRRLSLAHAVEEVRARLSPARLALERPRRRRSHEDPDLAAARQVRLERRGPARFRPSLNDRGRRAAWTMGAHMAAEDLRFDRSSPPRRCAFAIRWTRSRAAMAACWTRFSSRVSICVRGSASRLCPRYGRRRRAALLVGHNPGWRNSRWNSAAQHADSPMRREWRSSTRRHSAEIALVTKGTLG
jgi:hypothetical protein